MIKFTEKSFIIEVTTCSNPVDAWIETQKAILELLEVSADMDGTNQFRVFSLLKEMIPDIDHIKSSG